MFPIPIFSSIFLFLPFLQNLSFSWKIEFFQFRFFSDVTCRSFFYYSFIFLFSFSFLQLSTIIFNSEIQIAKGFRCKKIECEFLIKMDVNPTQNIKKEVTNAGIIYFSL